MRLTLTLLACSCCVWGQKHFSWQNYCFDHPSAPFCPGHDYAIKQPPPAPKAKETAPRGVITNRRPAATQPSAAPSLVSVGGMNWGFADPIADVLAGFDFAGILASPLGHDLIAELGAKQGVSKDGLEKVFAALSGLDQVALSVRDNHVAAMITGAAADAVLPAVEPGFKAMQVSAGVLVMGHIDAVDDAVRRVTMKVQPSELAQLAAQLQSSSEFWAIGPGRLLGPQAMRDGVRRFSITVSIGNGISSDVALEFNSPPPATVLATWQKALGSGVPVGNTVHFAASMRADEVKQKFGEIAASPVGQNLGALIAAARYLPARESGAPRQTKPVIYGLDGGPRVVQ